jgi:hypothetical protein
VWTKRNNIRLSIGAGDDTIESVRRDVHRAAQMRALDESFSPARVGERLLGGRRGQRGLLLDDAMVKVTVTPWLWLTARKNSP